MGADTSADVTLTGIVEEFDRARVSGWVEVAQNSDATRIGMYINEQCVVETWGFPSTSRRSAREVRHFRFALRDFWRFCGPADKVSVRAEGQTLPIAGRGMYYHPNRDRVDTLDKLADLQKQGYIFGQTGRLQLSKSLDKVWQDKVLGLYQRVNDVLLECFDYQAFLCYGSLLGQVRNNGLIGHDMDFDCAYVSRETVGRATADEFREIAFKLVDRGFDVTCKASAIAIRDQQSPDVKIDLFHLFFNSGGTLSFPFGVAGTTEIERQDWQGLKTVEYLGRDALIPVNAEAMVEHMYGEAWRVPNPGFKWEIDRTKRDRSGLMTAKYVEEVYWSNFYAHVSYTTGSTFCLFVEGQEDLPRVVVDIGCGDGRDSYALAKAGRKVVGLDRSEIGVKHATEKAKELGYGATVRFEACDAGDADGLRALIKEARSFADGGPLLFYTRFFLHSIPEETQEVMMETLRDVSEVGDCFAAEFRTDRDEVIEKVHGKHYRRFQNGPAFAQQLQEAYGFDVVIQQEGNGFSPYKGEDPELFRVIARRNPEEAPKKPSRASGRRPATTGVRVPASLRDEGPSVDTPVTMGRLVRGLKRRAKRASLRTRAKKS